MNILVVNRGSSSIKCSVYQFEKIPEHFVEPFWEGKKEISFKDSKEKPLDTLLEPLWEKISKEHIDLIGHRVVHGGRKYRESVLIDDDVEKEIENLKELAPLHNMANLQGIKRMREVLPEIPQVAVFDTAFHRTLPLHSAIYPGPYSWYEKNEIERFGFHGISFQYCTRRATRLTKCSKLVLCHLGSGASLCAVKEKKSIDTTMGFTPLEGLMMDTRSGTIDPGILLYLLQEKKISAEKLYDDLYHQSGLLGISGISEDMRAILKSVENGDEKAILALNLYIHRLNSYIGAMVASLQGIDALVFTGGIGENVPLIRKKVCENFSFLGLELNPEKNEIQENVDRILSYPEAKVQVILIHTQEAFEIARECFINQS